MRLVNARVEGAKLPFYEYGITVVIRNRLQNYHYLKTLETR